MEIVSGQVDIVIVNWNGRCFLEKYLDSVVRQTYPKITLLIIDNESEDGSVEWLRTHRPDVKVLPQVENLGFARAQNLGIRSARGEYYMPLNYDVALSPDFVERLVQALQGDARLGSVSGKLLRLTEDGQPTPVLDSTGHVFRRSRTAENRGEGEADRGQYDRAEEVFGVSGTAPLYRREMLESIRIGDEYYDESYFAYWEDVDLDWRARHAGWHCQYTPDAVAYHVRRGGRTANDLAVRLTFRNRYLTIIKNDRLVDLIKDCFHLAPYELHRWLQMTIDHNYRHLWSMIPATVREVPAAWRKRRRIQAAAHRVRSPPPRRLFEPARRWPRPSLRHPAKVARGTPITVITGGGRCGTSFVAQVFQAAGVDPGGGFDSEIRAGWEYAPVVAVNDEIRKETEFLSCADSDRLLPDLRARLSSAVEGKSVVKDPRFSFLLDLWVHAGLVERVILLSRPYEESIASAVDAFAPVPLSYAEWLSRRRRQDEYVVEVCARHGIPQTVIRFPDVVREEGDDFRRLVDELRRFNVSRRRARKTIREVRDPGLVQHTPGA